MGKLIEFRTDKSVFTFDTLFATLEVLCRSGWRSPISSIWLDDRTLAVEYPDNFDRPAHWRYRYPTPDAIEPPLELWYPQYGIVP
ncbi:unnamed protein product [marine sediment metagenome]|uniref:Uncharacterized protein n=1 Tax=marine sediment metagenome TaxID=412755 RepID=X1J4T0_9ZZZZ